MVRLEQNTDRTDRSMLSIGVGGTVTPIKSLKYKTKFNYYLFDRQSKSYTPSTLPSRTEEMGGYAQRKSYGEQSLYFENTLEFSEETNGIISMPPSDTRSSISSAKTSLSMEMVTSWMI